MVKLIIKYQCEVCGETYHNRRDAEECELGETEIPLYGIGSRIRIVRGIGIGCMGIVEHVGYTPPSRRELLVAHRVVYDVRVLDGKGTHRSAIQGIDVI